MEMTPPANDKIPAPVLPYADREAPAHGCADLVAVVPKKRCLLDSFGALMLIGLAILATLPGWLPKRVYLPASALGDPKDSTWVTTFAGQQIRHGAVPLWNSDAGLGERLLAKGNLGALAPTILPHLLKPAWSWTLSATIKLWIAGLGVWLLAGKYGLHSLPRLFSGAAFMLCGAMIFNITDPLTSAICWLPWCVLVVERLVDRVTLLRIVVGALVFAAQFLVGSPAASLAILLTCGAVLVLNLFICPVRAVAAIPAAVFAAAIGFGVAGVQWLPLWDFGAPLNGSLRWTSGWVGVVPLLLAILGLLTAVRERRVVMLAILAAAAAASIPFASMLLPKSVRTTNLCPPLIASAAMGVTILAGFGLANVRGLVPWRSGESAPDVRVPWLFAGVALIELLVVALWIHRGVPERDYAAAVSNASQAHAAGEDVKPIGRITFSGPGAVPRAWLARSADWARDKNELEERTADASFAPLSTVLFTKPGLSEDTLEWLGRGVIPDRSRGGPRGQPGRSRGFFGGDLGGAPTNPGFEIIEESANRWRIITPAGANGWLVIPQAYADGWAAKSVPLGHLGRGAVSTEHIVLPAYGALRAAEVDNPVQSELIVEYKPASFRRGLLVTTGSGMVIVLLLGCALIGKTRPPLI